jgi:hypothetical protein
MAEIKQVSVATGKSYGFVDIAIVLDTTGSMSGVIEAVKSNIATRLIGEMKTQMAKNQTKLDWRGRVIGYGDVKIGEVISENAFSSQEGDLVDQLMNLPRTGGGDEPESALDALMIAAKSPWRSGPAHKVLILLTDATTHSQMEQKTVPSGPRDVDKLIEVITGERIKLFLYGQQCDTFVQLKRIPKASIALWPESEINDALPGLDFAKEFEIMAKTISTEAMDLAAAPLPSKTA